MVIIENNVNFATLLSVSGEIRFYALMLLVQSMSGRNFCIFFCHSLRLSSKWESQVFLASFPRHLYVAYALILSQNCRLRFTSPPFTIIKCSIQEAGEMKTNLWGVAQVADFWLFPLWMVPGNCIRRWNCLQLILSPIASDYRLIS